MKSFFLYGTPLKGNGVSAFLFLLRLFVGIMMLTHGGVKLANFGSLMNTFPDPLGVTPMVSLLLSVSAEVGCSVLLIFGILTRLVTLPLVFNMLGSCIRHTWRRCFSGKRVGCHVSGCLCLFLLYRRGTLFTGLSHFW